MISKHRSSLSFLLSFLALLFSFTCSAIEYEEVCWEEQIGWETEPGGWYNGSYYGPTEIPVYGEVCELIDIPPPEYTCPDGMSVVTDLSECPVDPEPVDPPPPEYTCPDGMSVVTDLSECPIDPEPVDPPPPEYTCPDGMSVITDLSECQVVPEKELGPADDPCEPGLASVGVGNPINSATGNKYQVEVDYQSTVDGGIDFIRSYNSQKADAGKSFWQKIYPNTLGNHWRHHYQRAIVVLEESDSSGRLVLIRPEGQVLYFSGNSTAVDWVEISGSSKLISQYDETGVRTGWDYKGKDGLLEHYNSSGQIMTLEVSPGLTQTLHYNTQNKLESVTDPFGRTLQFQYGSNAKLIAIILPDQQVIQYSYDSQGRLSTVQYPDTTPLVTNDPLPTKTYHYENTLFPYALTGITDEKDQRFATWTYDEKGYANSSEHAGGVDHTSLVYDENNLRTSITDVLGQTRTYQFSMINGMKKLVKVEGAPSATCSGRVSDMTYDTQGNPDIIIDYKGNQTDYDYNEKGLVIKQVDAAYTDLQREIETEWHAELNLPSARTYSSMMEGIYKRIEYSYDSVGRLLNKTTIDPNSNQSRTIQYSYNNQGLLASINGSRLDVNDTITHEYDSQGNLLKIRNALNHVTEILEHNAHGQATKIKDPNGSITEFYYNARGRLIERRIDGVKTTFIYDATGKIIKTQYPDGSELNYQYDNAHRLTLISDAQGNQIQYTLDNRGNQIQEQRKDANGQLYFRLEREFDSLSRLLLDIDGSGNVTRYRYDKNDNLTARTDPRNSGDKLLARTLNPDNTDNSVIYLYDALNRVIQSSNLRQADFPGDDTLTRYVYNSLDQLVEVEDHNMTMTTYEYNGFGDLIKVVSAETGSTQYEYDSAGNRTKKTDAKGVITQYQYDVLNRATLIQYSDSSLNTSFTYDAGLYGIGQLTTVIDSSGQTNYHYNIQGQLTNTQTQRNGFSANQHYQYNAVGELKQVTYPSGNKVNYQIDNVGRVNSITLTKTDGTTLALADNIAYQPFGSVTQMVLGNGLSITQQYNLNGELNQKQQGTILAQQFNYDASGNILQINNTLQQGNNQQFTYNGLSQLTQAIGIYGTIQYQLNTTNDRISRTDNEETITSDHVFGTHQIQLTNSDNWLNPDYRDYLYDLNGNAVNNGLYQFSYDHLNRLSQVTQNGQIIADYAYNSYGERTKKSVTGQPDQHFFYDQNKLIAESDESGHIRREYIYLHNTPLAILDYDPVASTPKIYYYHTDHLGTPVKMTDANQQVVWSGDYKPFGDAVVNVETIANNLRFPGQYYDQETGLHYNYFRYYDPTTGRYITSDPIGLAGGINTYAYVGGNPLIYTDPYGLNFGTAAEGAAWGAAAGGVPGAVVGGAIGFGAGAWATNEFWNWYNNEDVSQNEKKPKNCPSGTQDIDKAKKKFGWDKDKLHGIKDAAHGGMGTGKSWTGVAPDGTVGINEDGGWSPQGHWGDLQ